MKVINRKAEEQWITFKILSHPTKPHSFNKTDKNVRKSRPKCKQTLLCLVINVEQLKQTEFCKEWEPWLSLEEASSHLTTFSHEKVASQWWTRLANCDRRGSIFAAVCVFTLGELVPRETLTHDYRNDENRDFLRVCILRQKLIDDAVKPSKRLCTLFPLPEPMNRHKNKVEDSRMIWTRIGLH